MTKNKPGAGGFTSANLAFFIFHIALLASREPGIVILSIDFTTIPSIRFFGSPGSPSSLGIVLSIFISNFRHSERVPSTKGAA